MLKNRQTCEIMTPESVGVKQTSLVMGKHSGRHAFKDKLNSLGYPDLTDDVVGNAFAKFKVLADKKKHCLLYTSPSPRDKRQSRMPSSA